MRLPKDWQPIAKKAREQNWTITTTGSGHLCWTSPQGRKVFTSKTPSDHRALHTMKSKLTRKGLKL